MKRFGKLLTISLLSMVSTTAMAQDLGTTGSGATAQSDGDIAQEDEAGPEPIIVTGSRIKQDGEEGFSSNVPTSVLTQEDIAVSGFTDLGQIVSEIPGVNLSDTTTGQPNGTIQNSGTVSIDLRDLGSARTLTLINGRRAISNASNRNVVSLNTIPVDFVERVEVITGAASAIYGSDAIAGVVNVITESDLKGFRLRGRVGSALTGGGGAEELTIAGTFGAKFADNRGYVSVSASYDDDGGLFARDRMKRATRNWSFDPATNQITEPDLSTDLLGGRFRGSSYFYDETGLRTGFVTAVNGYNDRMDDTLRIPRTVMAIAGKASFKVSDAFQPFVEAQFSDLDTFYSRDAIGLRNDTGSLFLRDETGVPLPGLPTFTLGNIPNGPASSRNPYIPTAIGNTSSISWRRRFEEVGNRDTYNDRDTLRVWAGAKGDIGKGWSYEASYTFGRFDQTQRRLNGINLQNLKFGLDVERSAGGVIQCRDAAARAAGCVPINLFGIGSITQEAADYIRLDSTFRAKLTQHDVLAYATGPLFQLPAGPVSLAIGGEYRKESAEAGSDQLTLTTINNVAAVPTFSGGFNVKEAFAEFSIPLLRDKPFFRDLSLTAAGRVADYSQANVGTVFSYNAGANWAPVHGLRFRAQYGVAQRAPNISELFSPPRDDTDTVSDICSGTTLAATTVIAQNCRLNPGILAAVNANGGTGVFTQSSTNIQSPNSGNLNLKEETGHTLTLGAVLSPDQLRGFTASVDYYHIRVSGAISALDNEVLLRQCYSDATNFATNPFCSRILRSSTGQIQLISQVPENLDKITVSGVDVAARYKFALDDMGIPGDITLRANWTHVIKDETQFQGTAGTVKLSDVGEIGAPQDVVRGRIRYSNKLWEIEWRTRYLGPVVSSNDRVEAAAEAGIVNPLYLRYPAYWRHDVSATMEPRFGGIRWKLTVGINNIFDKTGPDVPEGATPNDSNGYIADYGVVGRTGYASIQVRF